MLVSPVAAAEMVLIEAAGTPRAIGQITGEATREGIRTHLALFPPHNKTAAWSRRRGTLVNTLYRLAPQCLEELQATAEAAGVDFDDLLYLNSEPQYGLTETDRCTNVAFAAGPDGPVWGKNNDRPAHEPARPAYARVVRRSGQIPVIVFTYAGLLATADGMNAAGVAIGHSSVGSVFEQNDRHVPIRLWAYEGLFRARTTREFVNHMASQPMRGKGYALVCVDAGGDAVSLEAPCPVLQVRRPAASHGHVQCVNRYQLPTLAEADRRDPAQKCNAQARADWLEKTLAEPGPFDLPRMQSILRRTEEPAICRRPQTPRDVMTEYSMIALPRDRRVMFLYGDPGEQTYRTVTLEDDPHSGNHAGGPAPSARPANAVRSKLMKPDALTDAIRLGCRWIQDVAQIQTTELPPDTQDRIGFGYRIDDRIGFGYRDWRGAIRGEYHAGERQWWFGCPVWHTSQAVKALLLASRCLGEPRFIEGAKLGVEFLFRHQIWDPRDPDHGLLLAYEDVAEQVNTSAVMESLDGLMLFADHLESPQAWERAVAAGNFVVDRMFVPALGVFRDLYSRKQRKPVQTVFHTKDGIGGRPLLEDGVLLKLYDRTGDRKFLDAHIGVSERLVADQNPRGNWLDYGPCSAAKQRFHPRQTYWWAIPLIDTYQRTGRPEFLDTAIASGHFCRQAMRADGGYIRGTYTGYRTDSFGHETSGSACAAILFMRLFEETGDAEWLDVATTALRYCARVQFREPADPNLLGAVLEKVLPPDGSDQSPYYLRDLGTIFFVIAGVRYLEILESLQKAPYDKHQPNPTH